MLQLPTSTLVIITTFFTIIIITPTIQACSLGSKSMSACLHRYLERDFSLVEDLLRRPPYGENGHILIEEGELEAMCSKLDELKRCYEAVFTGECVAFAGYAQMKRILKVMRLVYGHLCLRNQLQGIKDLIEGGYCIEFVRKGSICGSDNPTLETANETLLSNEDLSTLRSVSARHRWPYTLAAMMRFEAGAAVCPYLGAFTRCMTPNVQLRCRDESRTVWRNASTAILHEWCGSSAEGGVHYRKSGLLLSSLLWALLLFWFSGHF